LSFVTPGQSFSLASPHLSNIICTCIASSFPGNRGFPVNNSAKKHLLKNLVFQNLTPQTIYRLLMYSSTCQEEVQVLYTIRWQLSRYSLNFSLDSMFLQVQNLPIWLPFHLNLSKDFEALSLYEKSYLNVRILTIAKFNTENFDTARMAKLCQLFSYIF
jgi:hypothetical protein